MAMPSSQSQNSTVEIQGRLDQAALAAGNLQNIIRELCELVKLVEVETERARKAAQKGGAKTKAVKPAKARAKAQDKKASKKADKANDAAGKKSKKAAIPNGLAH